MSKLMKSVIELAVQIQQIPAPTFDEKQRGEFVRGLFVQEGLQDVLTDKWGNVFGRWNKGGQSSSEKPLIVSAHLDTVFPSGTNLEVKREEDKIYGPGIGDNSLGVAALFG